MTLKYLYNDTPHFVNIVNRIMAVPSAILDLRIWRDLKLYY